jgi:hypothetical protein
VLTDVSEVLVTLMMVAISNSKTSVNFYQTTQYIISEDGHFKYIFIG